jgi:hypothetical protein
VSFSVTKLAATAGHPTRYPIVIRVSIITGCKLAKCCGGGERRETCSKLTAGLGTRTKKLCVRETRGPYINREERTIIWIG